MKEVDEKYLLEQRSNEDAYTFVFYNLVGCASCKLMKEMVESIEANFPEIEFVSFSIKDANNAPLFAPVITPSYMLLIGGMKIQELSGIIEHRLQLIRIIREWVL